MKFRTDDIVAFLNDTGTGKVIAVEGESVQVLNEFDFEEWYPQSELILRKRLEIGHVEQKDQSAPRAASSETYLPSELEKDLHFNQLVEFPKNFNNYEMLNIQLREARKCIDKARGAGIKKVILIHGVGEGRLKEEIHSMLERMDKLQFYDANYLKYGSGATEVQLL